MSELRKQEEINMKQIQSDSVTLRYLNILSKLSSKQYGKSFEST